METRVCCLHDKHDLRIETAAVASPGSGEVLIRIGAGGICGSDLHYYQHGGTGTVRLQEPLILGHEIAGTIEAIGADVTQLQAGDRIALNPSMPCKQCSFCQQGIYQLCIEKHFYGSASRIPHEQGAFRELLVAKAEQCHLITAKVSLAEAACAEPLAVCLHVRSHVPDLAGKTVLITGSGPIGCLCAAVAQQAQATSIVVTDLEDHPLTIAKQMGATTTINVITQPDQVEQCSQSEGLFDVVLECTGAQPAVLTAFDAVKPQGTIVQVGIAGDMTVPAGLMVRKEIKYVGTYRFYPEYAQAVAMLNDGAIDLQPIISSSFPLEEATQAFAAAGDRSKEIKVLLEFPAV